MTVGTNVIRVFLGMPVILTKMVGMRKDGDIRGDDSYWESHVCRGGFVGGIPIITNTKNNDFPKKTIQNS